MKSKFERMFVFGFFSIPLSLATKKLDIFSVLFVALSHCDKELFCLSHWATAKNRFLLHWVTVTNKVCIWSGKKTTKKGQKMLLFSIFGTFCYCLAFFIPFFVFFFCLKILHTLAFCVQYILILFVAVTQCDKQKSICRSDSVRQTKQIFVIVTQCDK